MTTKLRSVSPPSCRPLSGRGAALFTPGQYPTCASGEAGDFPLWSPEQVARARGYTTRQLIRGRLLVWDQWVRVAGSKQVVPDVIAEELREIDSEETVCAVLRAMPISDTQRKVWRNWWREVHGD